MTDDSSNNRHDVVSEASRRKLIEKAVYSMPTKSLRDLIPKSPMEGEFSSSLPRKSASEDILTAGLRLPEPGRIVSARLSFPELIVQKSKERAFLKELTDQLQVGLSGSSGEPLACTILPRSSDDDFAVVQLSLPLLRAEQLRSLLTTRNLLTYTPLLRFCVFDDVFFNNVVGPTTSGIREQISFPAPDIVSRLDEMEKRYLEIRDRRNIIESFHSVMKQTNPYDARAAALQFEEDAAQIAGPILPGSIPGFDGPGEAKQNVVFPWSGLSVPAVPEKETGYSKIIDQEGLPRVVRGMPPSATVVLTKNAIETAVSQLSVDGVQLSAASAEISRRIEEAHESAELCRIAAAGLASPAVLETLVAQSTLRREQQRQTDEQKVLAAWEKDQLSSGMRENSLAYMQRLFAIATGDEETLAELERNRVIMDPETVRVKMRSFDKKNFALKKFPLTLTVGKASNIPQQVEAFVRIKVGSVEAQTGTCIDGVWNEEIFLEVKDSSSQIEIFLFQYNSLGFDTLLAEGRIALRDTNEQVGIWVLSNGVSVSMRIDFAPGDNEFPAYQRLSGVGIKSAFPHDLQSSQNLLRERNMDFVFDQVERIEEERRRIESKIGKMDFKNDHDEIADEFFVGPTNVGQNGLYVGPTVKQNGIDVGPTVDSGGPSVPVGALRQVAKPFPTYEALYKELVGVVQRGRLGEARQLCFDLAYVGQSKLDFGRDPRVMEYLSLMSDVLVEFRSDTPIVVAGLVTLCVMLGALGETSSNRKQVALVLWEACVRSIPSEDLLLNDQVLTSLALVADYVVSSPNRVAVNSELIVDFAIEMFQKTREPVQMEQVMQIFAALKSTHRAKEQVVNILTVLERCRFNQRTVHRALIALAQHDCSKQKGAVELVVVAAGMYVDNGAIQAAAIEALGALTSNSAEQVENILGPIVIEQALERNMDNGEVQLGVAQLLLRIADMRANQFDVPEAIPALMRISASASSSVGSTIVALAAIRSCFNNSKKDCLPRNLPDPIVTAFVTALEKSISADASVGKEACLTIEALISSVDLREPLLRAGVVAVPLACTRLWSKEYPRMVKTILSSLHATVLSSHRGAFQFARLDGVQVLFDLAVTSTEWRAWAILADACCVEEAKASFHPDEDIARIVEFLGTRNEGDIEVALQCVRLVGEIAFNCSMSTKELFKQVNTVVRSSFGNVGFPLSTVLWGLLSRKFFQKVKPFERMTVPSGKELAFELSQTVIKEYNVWVTAQGGAAVGASVAKTPKEETPKGFMDSLGDYFVSDQPKPRKDRKIKSTQEE